MEKRRPTDALVALLAATAVALFLCRIPSSAALHRALQVAAPLPSGAHGAAPLTLNVRSAVDGRAVAFAAVRVFWADRGSYAAAGGGLTDARGVITLEGLPEGAAWVIVDARAFARRSTAAVLGATPREIDVRLDPAAALRVHVEDEQGSALPDATVLASCDDALPFGALTDGEGNATLDRLCPAPWKVRVVSRGFEEETRGSVVADATFRLRRASTLDVLVADGDGKPVEGALVLVAGPRLWPARESHTAADGHARLQGLEAGAYDLRAQHAELVSRTELGFQIERGKDAALTLVLERGRMIPVVVTDGEGDHPVVVRQADVLLVEGGVSSFPLQGRTDSFGKVTLGPVARGPLVAAARADGFVARSTVAVPEDLVGEVRIPLLRGATLRGDVTDGEGRPVEGATIEVVGTDPDGMPIAATPLVAEFQRAHFEWALAGPQPLLPGGELGVMAGPIPPIPNQPGGGLRPLADVLAGADALAPWVTRHDGTFQAAPVPPGRVRALVRHPSFVEGASEMVSLAPGGTASVRVRLAVGGGLEGTVVDESDIPVAGARVDVAAMQGTASRTARTADDGTFAFAALPDDVVVTVARPEDAFRPVLRRRVALRDAETTQVELVLPALREPVEVSAEDGSGRPVAMAQVTALSLDPDRPLRATAFTDDAGRAEVTDAAGLPLRLVVEAPGFARWTAQLDTAPEKVTATLGTGVPVEGHVTAVRGRQDVERATVELLSDGRRRSAPTSPLGTYRFEDVTPGPAHLTISHPDYATVDQDVIVETTGRADRAFELPPVDLEEPGVVEGRVVDGAGEPVAAARVGVGTVATYLPVGAGARGTTTTGVDGAFRLERVRPGTVDVVAYLAGTGRGSARGVVVDASRTTVDVVVHLDRAADEPEPTATGGVAVTLVSRGGAVVVAQVAGGSEAERAGLVAGDAIVSVDRVPVGGVDAARRALAGPDGTDVIVVVRRESGEEALRVRRERVRR